VRQVGFAVVAVMLGLLMIEGASRVALVAIERGEGLTERKHTRYDAELGWVSVPSTTVKDLYGPGRTLTVNAQGFRGKREYAKTPPPGVTRILCSGDSFTLGWGVDDGDAWSALLQQRPGLEVVNMGQGGYGIDQSYLWWRRDGGSISYDVHLLAVIDRCPLDILGYLVTHRDADVFEIDDWLPRVRQSVAALDLIGFVPIEEPDRVAVPPTEAELRADVDTVLRDIIVDDAYGLDLDVVTVTGTPATRVRQVVTGLRGGRA